MRYTHARTDVLPKRALSSRQVCVHRVCNFFEPQQMLPKCIVCGARKWSICLLLLVFFLILNVV